jgi:2-iminobutanoate/2-iminopropanoate deaminase
MMRRAVPLSALPLVLAACTTAEPAAQAQSTREYVNARSAADPDASPFSGAVRVGNTLYVSGSLGLDPGQQLPATAEDEARNVLNNIQATLETAGMTMDDLVSVQVFASDVADYDAFNSVYRTYFTQEFPARAFLGAGTLLFGARFEVMGIAVQR